ncbi:Geranylgeranyl transferase type-1 subunit beta [Ceratocystis platani]|uniref:Geranylgeranyl transferase type-1 subunit beta n=1 Tax=Ceratocystis fimbriata f. sp. platani TaxID=88771 RepID=A0A0F8BW53_CERFI|nr:Geranylgeranyl transferase type-1 subunit beta [Ceratocystis platani]
MAIERDSPSNLICMDREYAERIAIRKAIIEEFPEKSHGYMPEGVDSIHEIYSYLTETYLPTRYPTIFFVVDGRFKNAATGQSYPIFSHINLTHEKGAILFDPRAILRALGEIVQEDLFLLKQDPENGPHRLVAFVCCCPSGFDPSEKLGLSLRDIHAPVPSYDKIGASMERFFSRLETGKNVKRTNWSVTTHSNLFDVSLNHIKGDISVEEQDQEINCETSFARIERQTLSRLPRTVFLTSEDRVRHYAWALALQHPTGGFAGSPNQLLPFSINQTATGEPQKGPPDSNCANLAATFFALTILALVAEEDTAQYAFRDVNRVATLAWLRRLQREDGSFGEVVNSEGQIFGGRDMRYCYLAASVRWMLRGQHERGSEFWVEDINVEALVAHIRRAQTYDGGISESDYNESHAGYAYCAIAALALLGAGEDTQPSNGSPPDTIASGVRNISKLIEFLVYRQQRYLDEEDEDGDLVEIPPPTTAVPTDTETAIYGHVGFNGRQNKPSDTCYCWWAGATLAILGHSNIIDAIPARRFLVDKTQHFVGGFCKAPGGFPDIYHSYLGLAALATMGDPTLPAFDPALCCSRATVRKMIQARNGLFNTRT